MSSTPKVTAGSSGVPHYTTKYRCRCNRCGARFNIWSECGPSRICEDCAMKLAEVIYGCKITGKDKFGCWILKRI